MRTVDMPCPLASSRQRSPDRLLATLLVAASGLVLGCGKVAAYERGKLAHPTMAPGDAASSGQDHVYAIHEGAIGGTIGVASGCGCN